MFSSVQYQLLLYPLRQPYVFIGETLGADVAESIV